MESKTCYVVNFYLGKRRYPVDKEREDKLCYLRTQIECLKKYKHSLSKIVFNFNIDDKDSDDFKDALDIIPKKIQNTEVEVVGRKNYGMSYGAWSDNFTRLMDQYDYYIFNEDDYFIVQDDFDKYLVNKFNSLPNCGYLCGLVREPTSMNNYKRHAGMSSGISSYECLKKVHDHFGKLPHSDNSSYSSNEMTGQVGQSASFRDVGYEIYDIREEYRMRFFWGGYIDNYFKWNPNDFFLPAKIYYNEECPVSDVGLEREYLRMENDVESTKYFKQSTCYVVNFYLGDRRFDVRAYEEDKLCYLRAQIQTLEKYKHSLTKIVFNFNVESDHYDDLSEAFNIIPKKIQNTDVEVNLRENYGMSYGAWSDIFSKYQEQYDYYIFNEDDYVIVQDNFDDYLISKFNSLPNCGYLCGLVHEYAFHKPLRHAGMSAGISSYRHLKKLYDKFNALPHSTSKKYRDNELQGQAAQTQELISLGYDIYDIRDDYRIRFWNGTINNYFFWNDEDFFLSAKIYFSEDYVWADRINREHLRMEAIYDSDKYFDYVNDKTDT